MRASKIGVIMVGLASAASMAPAASILIDFENLGLSTGPNETIAVTDPSLSGTVFFSTVDVSPITVSDLSSISGAIDFGSVSISAASPIFVEFPTAVSSVSVQAGHNDGTSYSPRLDAFDNINGFGPAIGSDTQPLPAIGTLFNTTTLELDQPDIFSVELSGGGTGLFFDNIAFTTGAMGGGTSAAPLPSSMAMFPIGAACAGLIVLRNRRRSAQA